MDFIAKPQRILFVGMMGSGKSTVGHATARRLGWFFFDSDELVLAKTGRTVPEIFVESGESAMRDVERSVFIEALGAGNHSVVAVAGGVVLQFVDRTLLKESGVVVWLRARMPTLALRVGEGQGRPHLDVDPMKALAVLYEERRPFYELVADIVVDVDALTPEEVVQRVLDESHFVRDDTSGATAN